MVSLRARLAASDAIVDCVIAYGTNERLDYDRIGFEVAAHVDDWIEARAAAVPPEGSSGS